MSKSSGFRLRPAARVELVAPSEGSAARRNARIAFWLCTLACAVLSAGALYGRVNVLLAVIAGGVVGAFVGLLVGAVLVAWPVLRMLWHWAIEIALALTLWFGLTVLAQMTSGNTAVVIFAAATGAVLAIGRSRRWLLAMAWCVITRHRLRDTLAAYVTHLPHRPPRHPFILWARPTPAGVRVWLWVRLGLPVVEVSEKLRAELAGNGWGTDARITPASRRFAALNRVDVSLRDPLTGTISAPVAGEIPPFPRQPRPTIDGEVLALDLDDVPDIPAVVSAGRRGRDGSRP